VLTSAAVNINMLSGDITGNKLVNRGDVRQTKRQVGAPVTTTNFPQDVNATGSIDNADVSFVRSRLGANLP
jgi:hypothetical protein